jgi:hypothetical protein
LRSDQTTTKPTRSKISTETTAPGGDEGPDKRWGRAPRNLRREFFTSHPLRCTPTRSLIVRAAFNAVDRQIVDLTVLCMQQNGATISAGIINRVIASFENRWSADDGPICRRGNDLQGDFSVR